MSGRRTVRATTSFFEDLDRLLAAERGPAGEPSRADFQAHELFEIAEIFATGFDSLPPAVPGRSDYRLLIARGRLVPHIAVVAQLARDGAVELVQLSIDLVGLPEHDEHDGQGQDDDG